LSCHLQICAPIYLRSLAASGGNSSRAELDGKVKSSEKKISTGAAKKKTNGGRLLLFFGHVSIRLLRRIKFIGAFFIYYQQAAGGVSYYIGCAAGGGTAAIKRHTKTTISSAPSKAVSLSSCVCIIYTNVEKQMIFAAIKWGRWNYFTCVRTLFLLAARIIIRKAAFYWRLLCWQLHSSRYLFARGRRREERKLLNVRADNFRHLNAHIQQNIFRAIEFFYLVPRLIICHTFLSYLHRTPGLYRTT
jgi:hypothetical protein